MRDLMNLFVLILAFIPVVSAGCAPPATAENEAAQEGEDNGMPTEPIFGQTTDEIGEFDPNREDQVVDPGARAGNMFTYALEAYGPTMGKISKIQITQAVNLYWAEHGKYPETYEEFMDEVVKRYNIQLPVLPGEARYEYDVENHTLVVVAPREN